MITVTDVLTYTGSNDEAYAQTCLDDAIELVSAFVGTSVVPENILDRATLETASELVHRRNAPGGIQQFNTFDGAPVRINRDPMYQSYSILSKYVVQL